MEKLSSQIKITSSVIFDSQIYKEIESQLTKTLEDCQLKTEDRKRILDKYEALKRERAQKDLSEERLKTENLRLTKEAEEVRKRLLDIQQSHS